MGGERDRRRCCWWVVGLRELVGLVVVRVWLMVLVVGGLRRFSERVRWLVRPCLCVCAVESGVGSETVIEDSKLTGVVRRYVVCDEMNARV